MGRNLDWLALLDDHWNGKSKENGDVFQIRWDIPDMLAQKSMKEPLFESSLKAMFGDPAQGKFSMV